MKETEFKKLMRDMLGDTWIDGGSLHDHIMENNKKILNESISNKRREVSNKRKK